MSTIKVDNLRPKDNTTVDGADYIKYTPTGTIAATTVQDAIDEVVSDLSDDSGASLVGFTQSGTGTLSTTVAGQFGKLGFRLLTEYILTPGTAAENVTAIRRLVADTKGTGKVAIIPKGSAAWTVNSDIEIDEPLHVLIQPGAEIESVGSSTNFESGIDNVGGDDRYGVGLFQFSAGAEGSVFECYGTLDVNQTSSMTATGADVADAIQASGVLILACNSVKVCGKFEITRCFNGVTCVDSDYCDIDGYRVHTAPASGGSNAALDIEASDHGRAGIIRADEDYEEAVDFNTFCDDWDVELAHGTLLTQSALEINNCRNIRAQSFALNCNALVVEEYAADVQRWTRRGRTFSEWPNHNLEVTSRAVFDSGWVNSADNRVFEIRETGLGKFDLSVDVGSDVDTGQRIGGYLFMSSATKQQRNRVNIRINAAVNILDNSAEDCGIQIDRTANSYINIWAVHPMTASQVFVRNDSNGNGVMNIELLRSDTASTGTGVKSTVDGTWRLNGVMHILNFATAASLFDEERHTALPHLIGSLADGVTGGWGSGGSVTQDTDKSTGVSLSRRTGVITMNNAQLTADTTVSFTLTNGQIAATDYILISHVSAGTLGAYTVTADPAAGSAVIYVRNITSGNLSEAIVLKFMVLESPTS